MGLNNERIQDIKEVEEILLSSSKEFINESIEINITNF